MLSTGDVLLEARALNPLFPRVRPNKIKNGWTDSFNLCLDSLQIRSFARMDLFDGFMLAAYVAIIAQPLIYGSAGKSLVALMTPVK